MSVHSLTLVCGVIFGYDEEACKNQCGADIISATGRTQSRIEVGLLNGVPTWAVVFAAEHLEGEPRRSATGHASSVSARLP